MKETAVAIVGAGPFGVSLAAHLRGRGVDVRIFGEPMESWFQMPTGMFLRSFGFASNIDCPQRGFDEPADCRIELAGQHR